MEVVEDLGTEVFEAFGGVGKGLFESIAAQENMADDLAFVGFKRGFGLCIEGGGDGRRIGDAFCDGVAKELEDIVVLPALQAGQAVLPEGMEGVFFLGSYSAVDRLSRAMQAEADAAKQGQHPDENIPHQALVGQSV